MKLKMFNRILKYFIGSPKTSNKVAPQQQQQQQRPSPKIEEMGMGASDPLLPRITRLPPK